MSEVTLLGLCSDNLISIIQPSATVDCMFGAGNGCCGSTPTQSYADISGTGSIPQTHTLQLNTSAPAIVSGTLRLLNPAVPSNTVIRLAIPTAAWYSTLFVPAGTTTTIELPFSVPTMTNTLALTVTADAGFTFTTYDIPYTVLSL